MNARWVESTVLCKNKLMFQEGKTFVDVIRYQAGEVDVLRCKQHSLLARTLVRRVIRR